MKAQTTNHPSFYQNKTYLKKEMSKIFLWEAFSSLLKHEKDSSE